MKFDFVVLTFGSLRGARMKSSNLPSFFAVFIFTEAFIVGASSKAHPRYSTYLILPHSNGNILTNHLIYVKPQ